MKILIIKKIFIVLSFSFIFSVVLNGSTSAQELNYSDSNYDLINFPFIITDEDAEIYYSKLSVVTVKAITDIIYTKESDSVQNNFPFIITDEDVKIYYEKITEIYNPLIK